MTEPDSIASPSPDVEALVLLEVDGLPRAVRLQDAALKRAPVTVLACAPVSPGKALLIFAGDVASVEEALSETRELAGSRLIDVLYLPGIHPDVVDALFGERRVRHSEALAIVETSSAAATLLAADGARKTAAVQLGRLHLATGFGGRAYFTLWGDQSEVEAAVEAATQLAGEKLLDHEIIPAPHDELAHAAFVRPWALDPADPGGKPRE